MKFDEVEKLLKGKRISNIEDHRIEGMTQNKNFRKMGGRAKAAHSVQNSKDRNFFTPRTAQFRGPSDLFWI